MLKKNKEMHSTAEKELKEEVDRLQERNLVLKERQRRNQSRVEGMRESVGRLGGQVEWMKEWFGVVEFENQQQS